MNIITIIIVQYLFKLPIIYLVLITIAGIAMGILQSYVSIIVDLKKPKLEWSSEYAVVKQNMNLIWPVVLALLNITILIILTVVVGKFINSYILLGLIIVLYSILTVIVRNYIKNNVEKLFEKIY